MGLGKTGASCKDQHDSGIGSCGFASFVKILKTPRIASPRLLLGVIVASPGMLPAALDHIAFLPRQTALRFVECKRPRWGPEPEFGNISDEALGNRIT